MSNLARVVDRAERISAPLSALFELTGRCNLDCSHCYLDIANPPEELTTAEACAVVDQLADAGTMFLTLTGGELFLRPDALEIARHARARGMALRLFTNATRIDARLAREIAQVRPLGVEVSIYGAHAAAHDGVTQRRRTLRRTLRGLSHLKRAGVPIGLKAPLLQPVAGEIDRLHALAARLGAPIKFDPFVKPRNDGNAAPLPLRAADDALAAAFANPKTGLLTSRELPGRPDPDEAPRARATERQDRSEGRRLPLSVVARADRQSPAAKLCRAVALGPARRSAARAPLARSERRLRRLRPVRLLPSLRRGRAARGRRRARPGRRGVPYRRRQGARARSAAARAPSVESPLARDRMIALDARPRRAGSMAWQSIDGETVLLNIDARELLGVNEVAARVWALCDGALAEIAAEIAGEFEVDADTALADARGFLEELRAAGAIEL